MTSFVKKWCIQIEYLVAAPVLLVVSDFWLQGYSYRGGEETLAK